MALIPLLRGVVQAVKVLESGYYRYEVDLVDASESYRKGKLEEKQTVKVRASAPITLHDLPQVGRRVEVLAFTLGEANTWESEGNWFVDGEHERA